MRNGRPGSTGSARWLVLALALGAMVIGCSKKKPNPSTVPETPPVTSPTEQKIQVTKVELGNAVGVDRRVKTPTTSFTTKDTIFASVVIEGGGTPAELGARWTFQDGQMVNETKRTITPTGMEVTEFSIQKADGWPPGEYKVDISLGGRTVETKAFRVQ